MTNLRFCTTRTIDIWHLKRQSFPATMNLLKKLTKLKKKPEMVCKYCVAFIYFDDASLFGFLLCEVFILARFERRNSPDNVRRRTAFYSGGWNCLLHIFVIIKKSFWWKTLKLSRSRNVFFVFSLICFMTEARRALARPLKVYDLILHVLKLH